MRKRLEHSIDRAYEAFARQSDVRRAAILGIGFGLLLCVVVTLAFTLFITVIPRLR